VKKIIVLIVFVSFLFAPHLEAQDFDAVEKGYYETYVNDSLVDRSTKLIKLFARALQIKSKNLSKSVFIRQPNINVLSKVNLSEAYITGSTVPRIKEFYLDEADSTIVYGNACLDTLKVFKIISNKPFDFKGQRVELNNAEWTIKDSLLSNGVQLDVIKAISLDLIRLNCTTNQIIYEGPKLPDENILNEVITLDAGWTENQDGSFSYDAVSNFQYIVWSLKENVLLGETVKISFNVVEEEIGATFNLWLYGDLYNGSFANFTRPGNGLFTLYYKVPITDRFRFGIRARNSKGQGIGGAFNISNVVVKKI